MLTKQQHKLLSFLESFLRKNGISPSFEEMRAGIGIKSKSGIHALIKSLEERGFVKRFHNKARALEIIKISSLFQNMPQNVLSAHENVSEDENQSFNTSCDPLQNSLKTKLNLNTESIDPKDSQPSATEFLKSLKVHSLSNINLPFYGTIHGFLPITSFLTPQSYMDISSNLIPENDHENASKTYIILQVGGDFLKESGIIDNDIIIVHLTNEISLTSIGLFVVDNNEVHLKKWQKEHDKIVLLASHKFMMPQAFDHHRIRPMGEISGIFRKYF